MDLMLAFKSLIAGILIGMLFAKLRLPIPAPQVFSGVMGIFGVILGSVVVTYLLTLW